MTQKRSLHIFVVEDDQYSLRVADFLSAESNGGHKVDIATELDSTAYFLEYEPGISAYDCLVFDLSLPNGAVRHIDGKERRYDSALSGLEFILQNYDNLFREPVEEGRVAILTAYTIRMEDEVRNNPRSKDIISKITQISKLANNALEELVTYINEVEPK